MVDDGEAGSRNEDADDSWYVHFLMQIVLISEKCEATFYNTHIPPRWPIIIIYISVDCYKWFPPGELGTVYIDSNIAQNHSSIVKEVMSDHYLPPIHSERLTTKVKLVLSCPGLEYCTQSFA